MSNIELPESSEITVEALRTSGRAVIPRAEVAVLLEVDPRTVTRLIDDGVIFAIRTKCTVRIPLERFLSMFEPYGGAEADGPLVALAA